MGVRFPNKTRWPESNERDILHTHVCTHMHSHTHTKKTWTRAYLSHCDHVPLTSPHTCRRTTSALTLGLQLAGLRAQLQQQCVEYSKVRMECVYSGALGSLTLRRMAYCETLLKCSYVPRRLPTLPIPSTHADMSYQWRAWQDTSPSCYHGDSMSEML